MRRVYRIMLLAGLFTAGCFDGSPPEPAPLSPLEAFMASAQPGATTQLDDPAFGDALQVTQEEAFLSASGEDCRRAVVVARERAAEIVVVCRAGEKQPWKMMPRIMGGARK